MAVGFLLVVLAVAAHVTVSPAAGCIAGPVHHYCRYCAAVRRRRCCPLFQKKPRQLLQEQPLSDAGGCTRLESPEAAAIETAAEAEVAEEAAVAAVQRRSVRWSEEEGEEEEEEVGEEAAARRKETRPPVRGSRRDPMATGGRWRDRTGTH